MARITKEDIDNMYPDTFNTMFIKTKDDKINITYTGIIRIMDSLIIEINDTKDLEAKRALIECFIRLYTIYETYKGGSNNE